MNRLLFGYSRYWLQEAKVFPDAWVVLGYVDPPLNSNADYNVLFRVAAAKASQEKLHALTER